MLVVLSDTHLAERFCFFVAHSGRVFTTPIASLNIPECALFTDIVKRLKNDKCFHE